MNKKFKIFLITMLLILTAFCSYLYISAGSSGNSIVYMDKIKVFDNFQMKKDYDLLIEKELMPERSALDASANKINQFNSKDTTHLFELKKDYFIKKEAFDQKFKQSSEKYTMAVYEKLNAYIKEFAESKSYDFVLGTSGEGNIMYVSDSKDISEELIVFINTKYNK